MWDLDLGKKRKPKQRYFTEEEVARSVDAEPDLQYKTLYLFLYGTGVRINEAAGLYVEDIDFDNNVVYIRRQVQRGKEYDVKTDNGYRVIDIDPSLPPVLRFYLAGRRQAGFSRHATALPSQTITSADGSCSRC